MFVNDEVGESRTFVVYNGSASRINEIGIQLYPVLKYCLIKVYHILL